MRGKYIALDFDDTFTADPSLWIDFITSAKARGHDVACVSYRYETAKQEILDALSHIGIAIFCNGGVAKRSYMSSIGIEPDIWIDDMPELII